jgi:predicted nuclease of predicted toxin-antitoxin system
VRLKLDENLGRRCAELLEEAGHDVATVHGQQMCSRSDADLLDACRSESRGLVTLDLDFSNPIRFVPSRTAGIAVLRLPPRAGPSDLSDAVRTLASALAQRRMEGKLWIVQRGRIREYQEEGQEPT